MRECVCGDRIPGLRRIPADRASLLDLNAFRIYNNTQKENTSGKASPRPARITDPSTGLPFASRRVTPFV